MSAPATITAATMIAKTMNCSWPSLGAEEAEDEGPRPHHAPHPVGGPLAHTELVAGTYPWVGASGFASLGFPPNDRRLPESVAGDRRGSAAALARPVVEHVEGLAVVSSSWCLALPAKGDLLSQHGPTLVVAVGPITRDPRTSRARSVPVRTGTQENAGA